MTSRLHEVVLHGNATFDNPADKVAQFVLNWGNDPLWRANVREFVVEPPGKAVRNQQLLEVLVFAGMTFRTPTVIDQASELSASYLGTSKRVRVSGWRRVVATSATTCRFESETRITLRGILSPLTRVLGPSYRKSDAAAIASLPAVFTGALNACSICTAAGQSCVGWDRPRC